MTKLHAIAGLALLGSMAVLDFIWLSLATPRFYRPKLGALLNDMPVWPAAIGFYLLYAAGVAYFVLRPALNDALPIGQAMLQGAFLGLVAYGAYDLTNHATLKNWPASVTLIDMAWGAVMTALSVGAALWVARRLAS